MDFYLFQLNKKSFWKYMTKVEAKLLRSEAIFDE